MFEGLRRGMEKGLEKRTYLINTIYLYWRCEFSECPGKAVQDSTICLYLWCRVMNGLRTDRIYTIYS